MKPLAILILSLSMTMIAAAQDDYAPGPNSREYPGIPKGTVTQHQWESRIFANTVRDYYVYVPAQYQAGTPAALMVFQDGHAYVKADGDFRVPTVFDNLIAQGKMPVTIGLFINPGHDKSAAAPESPFRVTNRSIEYDEVSGEYGRFLLEEMIPELKKQYSISDDPRMRAICGLSSGGICAFSAAWHYPEQFHKVLSHIGSFTDIRGGHNYPPMIRKSDRKNIKVYLQDGSGDLNNQFGNWWLANQQMAAALEHKGYEYHFEKGTGAHNGKHGGAILPESLAWLWRDVAPQRVASGAYQVSLSPGSSVIFGGQTRQFEDVVLRNVQLKAGDTPVKIADQHYEQIVIVTEGSLQIQLKGKTQTIGPNSIAVISAGDAATLSSAAPEARYYNMVYRTHKGPDQMRGQQNGGSFIMDFKDIAFKPHDRGGVRNYFRKATAMCSYYEMHVTTLNGGIKSHEPHTHQAAELIVMIEGNTEMEVGNRKEKASKGDVYYLEANVPHAIRNLGDQPCMYFAYQWDE